MPDMRLQIQGKINARRQLRRNFKIGEQANQGLILKVEVDKRAKKYESKVYMRGLAPLIYGLNLAERALFLNFVKVA